MTESRYSSRAARWYVAILCLFGAVRIFWGAAGLPLFNDVDEDAHFDVVHKFARGQWPDRCQQTPDDETVRLLVMYSSREFLVPPESFPEGVYPPPPWTLSLTASRDAYVEDLTAVFGRWVNHETHSPPLYYGLAAVWYDLGRLVGLHGPYAAYWVRFLNIPLYVALIVAAYGFCRAYFSPTVALAVPALVAVFPSTVFFGINNDVLSPLMLLLALWLLLRWHAESASAWLSIAAGFAVSATVLVKLSNIAVLAACGVVALSGLYGAWKAGQFRQKCFPASLLLVSAAGPLAAWMLRNRLVLGDWTGDAEKIRLSGWQVKPWGQLFDHPLFSVAGQRTFWSTLVRTFYEGDMNWHGRWAMGFFPSEIVFYLSLAVLLIGLGAIWIGHRGRAKTRSRLAAALSALVIAGTVLFLIALSLRFDFGTWSHPSRQDPYFNSGRLLYGVLVPVLTLFVCGAAAITGRFRLATAIVVGISLVMMLVPQVVFFTRVLPSQYNWFHLVTHGPVQLDPKGPGAVHVPNSVACASYIHRGLAHNSRGELDKAIADYTEAMRIDPRHVEAYNNRSVAYMGKGQYDKAIADCNVAIRLEPTLASAYRIRGLAYLLRGKYDQAIADYSKAIGLDPTGFRSYHNRGVAYQKKGELEKAKADFAKAEELERKGDAAK